MTIDNLRTDHRVTVLHDFVDAKGVRMRSGETGILLGLSLDQLRMEIHIVIERATGKVDLVFPLRAQTGPRNGHMNEYFEMGDAVETASVSVTTPVAPSPPIEPERTQAFLRSYAGKQPPNDTSLGERRVACDCDPAFHRELMSARGSLAVSACLSCGIVTCSRSVGDDGRFTGDSWQENLVVALPDPVHRWISNWPRVKVDYTANHRWPMSADFVRYPTLYYPADTRCKDLAQLADLETRLTREQSTQSAIAKLRATHRVNSAPPSDVPEQLCGYAMLWQALQLRPRSDLADLLHHAQPRSPGCELAAEALRQRSDVFDLIVSSLRSADDTRRGVGFMIARDLRPVDPRLEGVLIGLMNSFSFDPLPDVAPGIVSRVRFQMIFLLVAELRIATPEMLATLRTLLRKLARHDHFLVDCVRIVLRELTAAPSPASHGA